MKKIMANKESIRNFLYQIFLILVVFVFLLLLEIKYPYYFLKDDNRHWALPNTVHNYYGLIKDKEFPLFNFNQAMGLPVIWLSYNIFFYISIFLSNLFWGHYFASIEILSFLYLFIGVSGFYNLLKYLKLDNRSAFFGAITWILSSFIIYLGNAWTPIVTATAAFFPWMIYLTLNMNRFSCRNMIYLVIVRLLLFYQSYPQYFIYSIIFEFITLLSVSIFLNFHEKKKEIIKIMKHYLLSFIPTVFLSLPLLLPLWHQTSISAMRNKPLDFKTFSECSYNILLWLYGMFYPFLDASPVDFPEGLWIHLHNTSHTGYVSLFFIVICLVKLYKNTNPGNYRLYIYSFSIPCIISFLWAVGSLNRIIYLLPLLNRFRWPFKLNLFTDFYLVLLAATGFFLFFRDLRCNGKTKNIISFFLIGLTILNYYYLYFCYPVKSLRLSDEEIPLKEPLVEIIKEGRIVSLGSRYEDPGTASGIWWQYATLFDLYHFAGYDPLMLESNAKATLGLNLEGFYNKDIFPLDYFRRWGVKWYIISKSELNREKEILYKNFLEKQNMVPVLEDEKRYVYYDEKGEDLFFWESSQDKRGINYNIKTNSIELEVLNEKEDFLILNFLYNPFFKAYLDGKEIEVLKNEKNPFVVYNEENMAENIYQMALKVPGGKHRIILKYIDPYFLTGCYISLIFLLIPGGLYFIKSRYVKKLAEFSNKNSNLTLSH